MRLGWRDPGEMVKEMAAYEGRYFCLTGGVSYYGVRDRVFKVHSYNPGMPAEFTILLEEGKYVGMDFVHLERCQEVPKILGVLKVGR